MLGRCLGGAIIALSYYGPLAHTFVKNRAAEVKELE
jgi:hypothetical protein